MCCELFTVASGGLSCRTVRVQEALIALRQKQIHPFIAWTLIWILASSLQCSGGWRQDMYSLSFLWGYVVSTYCGPLKAICARVWSGKVVRGAFIQRIFHFNHQNCSLVHWFPHGMNVNACTYTHAAHKLKCINNKTEHTCLTRSLCTFLITADTVIHF